MKEMKEMEEKVFKKLLAFAVVMAAIGLLVLAATGWATPPGYPPTRQTWSALASAVQPLLIATYPLPAVGSYSEGDLIFLATDNPILYRLQAGAWATASAATGGGAATGEINAAIATHAAVALNPHTANMTVTQSMQVGSGTPDTFLKRIASGQVQIASYVIIPAYSATPTAPVAGTLWMDSNVNKMKVYDGSSWNALW